MRQRPLLIGIGLRTSAASGGALSDFANGNSIGAICFSWRPLRRLLF
jgi:hypothetical protein